MNEDIQRLAALVANNDASACKELARALLRAGYTAFPTNHHEINLRALIRELEIELGYKHWDYQARKGLEKAHKWTEEALRRAEEREPPPKAYRPLEEAPFVSSEPPE